MLTLFNFTKPNNVSFTYDAVLKDVKVSKFFFLYIDNDIPKIKLVIKNYVYYKIEREMFVCLSNFLSKAWNLTYW